MVLISAEDVEKAIFDQDVFFGIAHHALPQSAQTSIRLLVESLHLEKRKLIAHKLVPTVLGLKAQDILASD